MRVGLFAATAMTVSLFVVAPAHADNSDDFLAMLSQLGVNAGDTSADVALSLAAANAACQNLHYGYSTAVAADQMHYAFPAASSAQLTGIVAAARKTMCEQATAPLTPDW